MANLLLVVHVLIALVIVGLILIQQGKGADMGASFGSGASQTVFGASGSGNFFSRFTGLLVAVFFITSFALAMSARNQSVVVVGEEGLVPAVEQSDDVPVLENAIPSADQDVPNVEDIPNPQQDVQESQSDVESQVPTE